jgi:hypothetical protein
LEAAGFDDGPCAITECTEEKNSKDKVAKGFNIVGHIIQLPAKKASTEKLPIGTGTNGDWKFRHKGAAICFIECLRPKTGIASPLLSFPP